jgi:hypothetical protein
MPPFFLSERVVTDLNAPTELPPSPHPTGAISMFKRLASRFIIPGTTKAHGLRLVFDLEADALLDAVTKVHCVVVADLDSDEVDEYGPDQIDAALEHLKRADYLVAHNAQGYG